MNEGLITQVLWTLEPAGAERMVLELSKGLMARGWQVRVVALGGGGELEPAFREAGIHVEVGPITRDRRKLIDFLKTELTNHRPTILHTHLGGDIWGNLVARKLGIKPVICTVHNEDRGLSWLYQQARRLAYGHASQVVCVSEVVKHYAGRQFGVPARKLQVIRLGIDPQKLSTRGNQPFYDTPKLVTVGRLTKQKDHATLFKALARVKKPWKLEVIGGGELKDSLQRLASTLGILPRIRFAGVIDNVEGRLAQADLFCFPSRWEGQGLALLEAAGTGVPCIVSDIPVFRELFNEDSMFFAPTGSELEWAKKIDHILSNPREALHRSALAKQIVLQNCTQEQMVDAYTALYHRLVS